MGLREQLGGMVELALNKAIDNAELNEIKEKVHALIDKGGQEAKEEADKFIDEKLGGWKVKLKANYIDLIDGKDDIPDVD